MAGKGKRGAGPPPAAPPAVEQRPPAEAPAAAGAGGDRLEAYRAKRSADRTPEPFGTGGSRPRLYLVQKHAARRLHYDLRLEWGGVLRSWAVPQGPATDPAEKRLAVEVEDHPVEYADFEGIIPEGNYGAGEVILWDRGLWIPLEDVEQGFAKGKLLFELRGYKLRGVWTLVRTKRSPKEWLLIKKPGEGAGPEAARRLTPESILSGLSVEELRQRGGRAAELRAELERQGAPRRAVGARDVGLMLAETGDTPFSHPEWLFELKYDGFRMLAAREGGRPLLLYRRGSEVTPIYPEIALALAALPFADLVLDGEVVVMDERGQPSFQRLQRRALLTQASEAQRQAVENPAAFYAFDLLACEGFDLRPLPLIERKRLLARVLPGTGPLRYADHVEAAGEALYAEVRERKLEGVLAKRAASPYRAGRSPHWLKLRVDRQDDFVVVGISPPRGARHGIGALHLAAWAGSELVYAGRAGSGLGEQLIEQLLAELAPARRPGPACSGPVPRERGHLWVEPRLVCEVRYKEWTGEGLLRQPVFLRLRADKTPEECLHPLGAGAAAATSQALPAPEPPPAEPAVPADATPTAADSRRHIAFTNPRKVFWPAEGYTKGDLVEFYRQVGPWLLPYLRDRPVVLTRFPDGITGKSFYQKDAPTFAPAWVRTENIWSEHTQREIGYFVADDLESLLYIANLGTIPLHVWSSRTASLQNPDWSILDLDPKGAPFTDVVRLALAIRRLCQTIGLPTFIKTSGSTGLHVLIPLGGACTYAESRSLAELLSRLVVEEHPDIATVARPIGSRGGRVYLDFGQNRHGQLLVSPFSVRPLPGAPVSTPLEWDEVDERLDPGRFTIRTVIERLERAGGEPLRPVLELKPDLPAALARLAERLGRG